ncbi:GGDEF domain-containing protein [Actinoplanes cyaneus]|uniref:GGDEF domain-containing protein n=1 Tax=Actinoplanes cyaneus TaxID=52696 RepID=UPI001943B3DA|nr:GGDEF domain-containing protein [Actinoplanes cyaneus]
MAPVGADGVCAGAAVLLIDLDGFKQVNDTYGHEIGDQMLIGFADVLRRTVQPPDVPARLGGDEFAVLLPAVGSAADATTLAQRILDECRRPLNLSGHIVHLRASIGVAVSRPGDPSGDGDPHQLLHQAELAMYTAKRGTKNAWVLYSAELKNAGHPDGAPAAELPDAVDEGLYQPSKAPGRD